jgi:hypothetical protein
MKEIFELLRQYIDAKIDYEFASREEDESGDRCSAPYERREQERIWNQILRELEK